LQQADPTGDRLDVPVPNPASDALEEAGVGRRESLRGHARADRVEDDVVGRRDCASVRRVRRAPRGYLRGGEEICGVEELDRLDGI